MPTPRRALRAAAEASTTPPTTLPPTHTIMRVTRPAGNNLLEVAQADGSSALVELPGKLRGTIWVRRGGYVVVDTAALAVRGNKLAGEVVAVVMNEREWKRMAWWPGVWKGGDVGDGGEGGEDSEDEDGDRVKVGDMPPSEDEDEDEDGDEEGKRGKRTT